jgi:hypothetical protein
MRLGLAAANTVKIPDDSGLRCIVIANSSRAFATRPGPYPKTGKARVKPAERPGKEVLRRGKQRLMTPRARIRPAFSWRDEPGPSCGMSSDAQASACATHSIRQWRTSPEAGVETQVRSGSGGHVGGEDVVRVAVQVLAGPVIPHGRARVGVPGGDLDIPQVDAGIKLVVTNVWRSMWG